MNAYNPPRSMMESEITPDGLVTIPEAIRRAAGLAPGRPVVVGVNERGEVVVLTRTQARRLGETPEAHAERIDRAFASIGDRFSTGQSTAEIMEELRGPREG